MPIGLGEKAAPAVELVREMISQKQQAQAALRNPAGLATYTAFQQQLDNVKRAHAALAAPSMTPSERLEAYLRVLLTSFSHPYLHLPSIHAPAYTGSSHVNFWSMQSEKNQ